MSESDKNQQGWSGPVRPAVRHITLRSVGPFLGAVGLAVLLHFVLLSKLSDEPQEPAADEIPSKVVEVTPAAMAKPVAPSSREPALPVDRTPEPAPVATGRGSSEGKSEGKRPVVSNKRTPATGGAASAPVTEMPASATATADTQFVATTSGAAEPVPVEKVPVYATRVPPSTTLRYVMSRGPIAGEGELRWQRDGSSYELKLEGKVPLLGTLLTQVSRGGFDSAGIAPERHTDKRRRRGEQAANFQRDAKLITFSGSSAQYPLVPGAQDRVSWMLQLAAIAQAWRGPLAAGEHIVLFVASARGDADVWSFRVLGNETVSLPAGTVPALKLLREPRRPYDTKVEVWLDPARHYLPVRARLTDTNGDPFELQLSEEIRTP